MSRPSLAVLASLLLTLGAGCGGSGPSSTVAGSARAEDKEVIREWVDALRAGHVDQAAGYFTIPTLVENGTPAIPLTTREAVREFNESLPCGARLVHADSPSAGVVTATFRLTERPGGHCGSGTGQQARTRFLIRDGKIAVWKRIPDRRSLHGPIV
jgi:hypothetical protein